jgi:hypothetical protein
MLSCLAGARGTVLEEATVVIYGTLD